MCAGLSGRQLPGRRRIRRGRAPTDV